jgi:DNA ligase-1
MLASPAESLDAALVELGSDVSVEFKLDGARIQVHRDGDVVRAWTRTLNEVTDRLPEVVELVRRLPCRQVVLDGETLALHDDGRPRPFQETASRFGAEAHELVLRPFFFDCLHVDGRDLIDEPLSARLEALQGVAGEHRMPGTLRPSPTEAAAFLEKALGAGHEGVMVKALDAPYAAGRRGRAWQKVKPVHTLDLVVLGAEWGYGRRTGTLSNIHLGARDPAGGEPVMVGKTFKGMTDALLAWQTETFPRYAREQRGNEVLLRPELVVEIELDGVQRSPRYPGGVALRFARVVRYRPDKTAAEADTIQTLRALLRTPPAGKASPAPAKPDSGGDAPLP